MKKLLFSMMLLANCATIFGAAGPQDELSIEDLDLKIKQLEGRLMLQERNYGFRRLDREISQHKTSIDANSRRINEVIRELNAINRRL